MVFHHRNNCSDSVHKNGTFRREFVATASSLGVAGLSPLSPVETTVNDNRSLYHVTATWENGHELTQPVFAISTHDAMRRFTHWWEESGSSRSSFTDGTSMTSAEVEADL
jgi:hypothetical protein